MIIFIGTTTKKKENKTIKYETHKHNRKSDALSTKAGHWLFPVETGGRIELLGQEGSRHLNQCNGRSLTSALWRATQRWTTMRNHDGGEEKKNKGKEDGAWRKVTECWLKRTEWDGELSDYPPCPHRERNNSAPAASHRQVALWLETPNNSEQNHTLTHTQTRPVHNLN